MIVLDACVLLALTDKTNIFHASARRVLSLPDQFAITALTGAEVMVYPMAVADGGWPELLRDFAIDVVPIVAIDIAAIAAMRRQSGLKMPGALVLWLAQRRDADVATFDDRLAAKARQFGLTVQPGED